MNHNARKLAKFILLDDDPVFCSVLAAAAAQLGMQLDCYYSILELGEAERQANLADYQAAIVDFHLGNTKGNEATECLQSVLHSAPQDIPTIIVSADESIPLQEAHWPRSINGFMPKRMGPHAILRAAAAASETHTLRRAESRL